MEFDESNEEESRTKAKSLDDYTDLSFTGGMSAVGHDHELPCLELQDLSHAFEISDSIINEENQNLEVKASLKRVTFKTKSITGKCLMTSIF